MTISFIRTIILYLIIIFAFRMMGKRQIGQFSPTELVVAMMVSDLAAQPAYDTSVPLLSGVIPILALVIIEIVLSFVSLKSDKARTFFSGSPVVLVRHGKIIENELSKLRLHLDDLFEEIRGAGFTDLSEIDFMMLETNGTVSVIPKSSEAPPTRADLHISAPQEHPHTLIIADGKLREKALSSLGLDQKWVYKILKKHKINSIRNCLVLTCDENQNIFIQEKGE